MTARSPEAGDTATSTVLAPGQAQDLAGLAGVQDRRLALRSDLVNLPLVAGSGDQVAVIVLDQVPDVGCFQAGERLELASRRSVVRGMTSQKSHMVLV